MASRLMRWETSQKWRYVSPIDWAAAKGQVDVVKELLRMDPNLFRKLTSRKRNKRLENMWDEGSCVEARVGRALVAKELLREDAYKIDVHGGWALFLAVAAADVTMVESLLAMKPELAKGQGEYKSADLLTAAAQGGSLHILRLLMSTNPESTRSKGDMGSALHAAALGGMLDILREVLQAGEEHNENLIMATNSHGATALDAAASAGHLQVVQELIRLQPDMIHHRDNIGNTALHTAAQRGHVTVVEELLKADKLLIDVTNDRGDTPLHVAVYGPFHPPGEQGLQRALSVVNCLMTAKPELVNCKNKEGRTALHFAVGFAYSYSAEIVKILLAAPGIDPCAVDNEGMTVLDVARASLVSEEVIDQLRSAGVSSGDLRPSEHKGQTSGDSENQDGGPPRLPRRKRFSASSIASSEDAWQMEKPGLSSEMHVLPRPPSGTSRHGVASVHSSVEVGAPTVVAETPKSSTGPPSRTASRKLSASGSLKKENLNLSTVPRPVPGPGPEPEPTTLSVAASVASNHLFQVPVQEMSPAMSVITNPISDLHLHTGDEGADEQPASSLGQTLSFTAKGGVAEAARTRRPAKLPPPPPEAQGTWASESPRDKFGQSQIQRGNLVAEQYPLFVYQDAAGPDKRMESVIQIMPPSAPSTPSSRMSGKMFHDSQHYSVTKGGPNNGGTLVGSSPSFQYAAELHLEILNKELHRQRVHGSINTVLVVAALIAVISFVGLMAPLTQIKASGTAYTSTDVVDQADVYVYYIYYGADALAFLIALFSVLLLLAVVPVQPKSAELLLSNANKLVWVAAVSTVVAFIAAVNIVAGKHHPTLAWAISGVGIMVCALHFVMMLLLMAKFCRSGGNGVRLYQMASDKGTEKHLASPAYQLNSKMKDWPEQTSFLGDSRNSYV